jgi:hypothetical protein
MSNPNTIAERRADRYEDGGHDLGYSQINLHRTVFDQPPAVDFQAFKGARKTLVKVIRIRINNGRQLPALASGGLQCLPSLDLRPSLQGV